MRVLQLEEIEVVAGGDLAGFTEGVIQGVTFASSIALKWGGSGGFAGLLGAMIMGPITGVVLGGTLGIFLTKEEVRNVMTNLNSIFGQGDR